MFQAKETENRRNMQNTWKAIWNKLSNSNTRRNDKFTSVKRLVNQNVKMQVLM